MRLYQTLVLTTLCITNVVHAIWLDTNNDTTIREDCNLIAKGLLDYYEGTKYGGTIGMFTPPYYWWEAGGAWGGLIDYTFFFENDTLVPLIKAALEYQTGDDNNYVPLNQSTTEGNDDQGFWGIAVMGAAERNFSNPEDPDKAWLTLAQSVFNTMTARWDENECNGGLRWQIFQWNSGYDYKNSVSNGCLFHIAARLARYTSNDTYVEWAERVWDWMYGVGLLTEGDWWFVYDGAKVANNCSNITKYQWTYNQGLMLAGCAYLYSYTQDKKWYNYTHRLLDGSRVFFKNISGSMVMYEAACQPSGTCNNDQRSFKAYFSRFLGLTSVLVPDTEPIITKWLVDSANSAAGSCSGGTDGHTCGLDWTNWTRGWDGMYGLGEQMSALEVMQNLMAHKRPAPYTASNGGSSLSNPAAGYGTSITNTSPLHLGPGDKAGAGIITAIVGVSLIGTCVWLIL
ncbi:mannan endo-1,6-alpha-mannosidase DCW1 precursor [Spathaspora passalidarum NRRL Y-27907]|uniref:Mannan endo-1,6-alpha-mannosidase n=1 Tax=Spathaspora passalidarum (strain NRRL Y-27907 / 11-Y1) TaxID=619300 RepID=G3AMT4_SPAPN|nr:mannan endo-1,6-alpha-mannosidase DCW1 precursor [Spathaspora passalidarum NRRL Y-27907]EGW33528.1 mannan endo-1,6-alpha-mannosidase DCW1 precursor [Spathaspora passalidarum NRRL Y-27907]